MPQHQMQMAQGDSLDSSLMSSLMVIGVVRLSGAGASW